MATVSCGGFSAVNFKLDIENSANRHFFVKQHDGKDDVKPSERTLFILNVPQYINEKCILFMYEDCGAIECVYIHSKPKNTEGNGTDITSFTTTEQNIGYKVAYIVFKNSSGLKRAMKCKELPPVPIKKFSASVGLKKWSKEYNSNFIDVANVQKEIETYMADYDKKVEDEKRKSKEMDSVEDEEGWVTITKHSKKPKISRNENVSKKIIAKQNGESARKTLLNFYRVQQKASKMDHIVERIKLMEKDRERIAQMKANRKFKPY